MKNITKEDCVALETAWAARDVLQKTEENYKNWAAAAGQSEDPEVLRGLVVENLVGAMPALGPEERITDILNGVELACACELCGRCRLRFNEDCELLRIGLRMAEA